MVGMLKTTVRRFLKQAHLERPWWSYACRFAGHMMREKVLGRTWTRSLFGQLVGIWRGHDKDQAKPLDDCGVVGNLLDIVIWQSGATRITQDGIVVKGLSPKPLDALRYHVSPRSDLTDLEKGMPWRSIQDEFGKHRWIDTSRTNVPGQNHMQLNTVWHVKKAIYGLREAPRLCQGERGQQLRDLKFLYGTLPGQESSPGPKSHSSQSMVCCRGLTCSTT